MEPVFCTETQMVQSWFFITTAATGQLRFRFEQCNKISRESADEHVTCVTCVTICYMYYNVLHLLQYVACVTMCYMCNNVLHVLQCVTCVTMCSIDTVNVYTLIRGLSVLDTF